MGIRLVQKIMWVILFQQIWVLMIFTSRCAAQMQCYLPVLCPVLWVENSEETALFQSQHNRLYLYNEVRFR